MKQQRHDGGRQHASGAALQDRRRLEGVCEVRQARRDCVEDADVNLSATSARRSDPLRDLLNSALSSPSGRCVVTDDAGALLGTATDHDVIDAIKRAKDARSAGVSA
jgi:osmoprotectant transport system ATP-binding protein